MLCLCAITENVGPISHDIDMICGINILERYFLQIAEYNSVVINGKHGVNTAFGKH